MCAGGGYVLSMVNTVVSVRAQSDPATPLRTVRLFDLFQGTSGDGFGDPHCIYHAASGRFFAVAYQTTSTVKFFCLIIFFVALFFNHFFSFSFLSFSFSLFVFFFFFGWRR